MDRNNGNIINNSPEYIFKKIFGKFKYEEYKIGRASCRERV